MPETEPIYAPGLPERIPGQVRKVVKLLNIPLPIAEDMAELASIHDERPDDVAVRAIIHLDFIAKQEMAGKRFFHVISGEDLLGGEDIVRPLDFGYTDPEHQGIKGKVRRFLKRHRII